jgi:hypothetical protein
MVNRHMSKQTDSCLLQETGTEIAMAQNSMAGIVARNLSSFWEIQQQMRWYCVVESRTWQSWEV